MCRTFQCDLSQKKCHNRNAFAVKHSYSVIHKIYNFKFQFCAFLRIRKAILRYLPDGTAKSHNNLHVAVQNGGIFMNSELRV